MHISTGAFFLVYLPAFILKCTLTGVCFIWCFYVVVEWVREGYLACKTCLAVHWISVSVGLLGITLDDDGRAGQLKTKSSICFVLDE